MTWAELETKALCLIEEALDKGLHGYESSYVKNLAIAAGIASDKKWTEGKWGK